MVQEQTSLKYIFYLELWQQFCLAEQNHLYNLVEGIMRNISVKLVEFGKVVQKISYLELWQLSCSAEQNHLCNFGRGHYGKHSCEIILN